MKTNRVILFLLVAIVLSAAIGVAQLAKLADPSYKHPWASPSLFTRITFKLRGQ